MMRIKDIDITQESVEKFLDEINIEALADSIKMSLDTYDIEVNTGKTYYTPSNKEFNYTLKNTNTIFGDMGAAA